MKAAEFLLAPVELAETSPSELCGAAIAAGERGASALAALVCDPAGDELRLLYLFRKRQAAGWHALTLRLPPERRRIPSIVEPLHAADWREREIEDLFGVVFEGHPRLGDFVLHDERWREQLAPMLPVASLSDGAPAEERLWQPHSVLRAAGAFTMPVGPVYSGVTESALFLLETLGEDVLRASPRTFYKYRALEKIVESLVPEDALLRVERCSGTSAVAHAWAFAQAIERIAGTTVDSRTGSLRALLAELERYRHHVAAIREICESTSTLVATSQASLLEEELLRLSCDLAGHRYLFGAVTIGGVSLDIERGELAGALERLRKIDVRLSALEESLRYSSGFLDRIEEVGIISLEAALSHGLVGPLARASGVPDDLRASQPYGPYGTLVFEIPTESEGDGYARLRVLFAEARQSLRLIEQLVETPEAAKQPRAAAANAAIGWSEAPRGACIAYVRLHPNGTVARLHLTTPSFANWLGFYVASEAFAFQDFPIILATLDLSVAESDR
jgi:Ni,Fe-hydrogenase III large subunit